MNFDIGRVVVITDVLFVVVAFDNAVVEFDVAKGFVFVVADCDTRAVVVGVGRFEDAYDADDLKNAVVVMYSVVGVPDVLLNAAVGVLLPDTLGV